MGESCDDRWDGSERRRPLRRARDVVYAVKNGDGDMAKWVAIGLTAVLGLFAGFGTWVTQAERLKGAETEISQIKKLREQDRADAYTERKQIKDKIEKIDEGVNKILIYMKAQEIRERDRDRRGSN